MSHKEPSPSVLIADPSRFHSSLISIFCREIELRWVFQAQDACDVIERAIKLNPTIVLAEATFPQMQGKALIRLLKQFCPKAILLACTNQHEKTREMIRAGASACIPKPLDASQREGFQKSLLSCICR